MPAGKFSIGNGILLFRLKLQIITKQHTTGGAGNAEFLDFLLSQHLQATATYNDHKEYIFIHIFHPH
jgi:hypothetical protein